MLDLCSARLYSGSSFSASGRISCTCSNDDGAGQHAQSELTMSTVCQGKMYCLTAASQPADTLLTPAERYQVYRLGAKHHNGLHTMVDVFGLECGGVLGCVMTHGHDNRILQQGLLDSRHDQ